MTPPTRCVDRMAIVSDEANSDFVKAVEICLPLGIRAYELRNLPGGRLPYCEESGVQAVIDTARAQGLTLLGVSPGFFKQKFDNPARMKELEEGLPLTFRLMGRLGVRRITLFTFPREGETPLPPQAVLDFLGEAYGRCKREGFEVVVENNAGHWADTGAHMAAIARALDIKLTWDPANAAASGEQAVPDGYGAVRDYTVHAHLKNWTPEKKNIVPLSDGIVDIAEQVRLLKADGYPGYYCLEPHQWKEGPAAVRRDAGTLMRYLAEG